MNAVDSEHKKNLRNDWWRMHRLGKHLCDDNHCFHKFSTGDLSTLKDAPEKEGIYIRKVLMDFHKNYYSPSIMKLVVYQRYFYVILRVMKN